MKLFAIYIGGDMPGAHVEVHDVRFVAATSIEETHDALRRQWWGAAKGLHIAGGIAGGITTGQPVKVRVAFKPTSSILTPMPTVTRDGEATEMFTKGRHDPCVGIRGVPVVEAMMALVLADHKLLHRGQCG